MMKVCSRHLNFFFNGFKFLCLFVFWLPSVIQQFRFPPVSHSYCSKSNCLLSLFTLSGLSALRAVFKSQSSSFYKYSFLLLYLFTIFIIYLRRWHLIHYTVLSPLSSRVLSDKKYFPFILRYTNKPLGTILHCTLLSHLKSGGRVWGLWPMAPTKY